MSSGPVHCKKQLVTLNKKKVSKLVALKAISWLYLKEVNAL